VRIRRDLFTRLSLVVRDAEQLAPGAGFEAWDHLADDLGKRSGDRVTFIGTDGVVLGDTDVSVEGLSKVENHASRPEVVEALHARPGASTRYSITTGQQMMYVTLPVPGPGGAPKVIARLATPLVAVEQAEQQVRHILGFGVLLALGVAVLMSSVAASFMSRALQGITQAARRMSAGDLEVRTRLAGNDEIAELGRTLDTLANNLSNTLHDLRAERDLLGRILESMQEGVMVLDGQRRILLMNPSLRRMLLVSGEVVGRSPIEVIRNADLDAMLEQVATKREAGSGEIELGGLRPRRLTVHATLLSGGTGGVAVVFVDVTDMRKLETMRRDFVANVSHELRTPITAVRSAAETLQRSAMNQPAMAARFLEMIERNAERLQVLVEDLLDLSKIESKAYRPKSEPVELAQVAQQVLTLLRPRADARRMKFASDIPRDLPHVVGDAHAIEQVLTNLVENAVKYCPDGSSVTVRATTLEGRVRVAVADTGQGIDAKHLPRLFERFYRVDKGRSRDMGGTGLGLSIVKHLVEAMGGTVGVESVLGRGTTFTFSLHTADSLKLVADASHEDTSPDEPAESVAPPSA
jgi:two-component system phosphate regulon sensor histidine kinase PhoR